jgi:hypothetical protein
MLIEKTRDKFWNEKKRPLKSKMAVDTALKQNLEKTRLKLRMAVTTLWKTNPWIPSFCTLKRS